MQRPILLTLLVFLAACAGGPEVSHGGLVDGGVSDGATGGGVSDGAADGGCATSCTNKTCGEPDGCGGACTTCPAGTACLASNQQCETIGCTPDCTNKGCGDTDGCSGHCTGCPSGQACNPMSLTCSSQCTASCTGKTCGQDDGCGGRCTTCPTGMFCDAQASTCKTTCTPDCTGLGCGSPDGCGGTCTQCPSPGQGCNTTTGQCQTCTATNCSPNGSCVFGWDVGQHCRCDAGYYETLQVVACQPSTGSPCDGVTCSGHGTCYAAPPFFSPECRCDGDYIAYGLACSPRDKLRCIDSAGKLQNRGTVRCSADDTHYEVCRDGNADGTVEWVASGAATCAAGLTCSACMGGKCDNGDGTGGQACPTGTVCMGLVHEIPVYQCQPGCDCSNCGTCDPGQFTGYQRACGSSANSFSGATIACTSPCNSPSEGCLPYGASSFCFGSEGCQSAAPQ